MEIELTEEAARAVIELLRARPEPSSWRFADILEQEYPDANP